MTGPLTSKEFAVLVAALGLSPGDGPFAVATSGGPDSMALALLFKDWGEATFLTFDHRLRKESKAEALQVKAWLAASGQPHEILTWRGAKPATGIQAAARQARYQALEGWCRERGVNYLFLAHTRDDQAETFLIRLLRGSGVDGLAAMAPLSSPVTGPGGPRLVRPLLDVTKAALIETLKMAGQEWIEDPSNENPDFLRVQVRQLLRKSKIEGFDVNTLAKTAARMARVRGVLEGLTRDLLGQCLEVYKEGYGKITLSAFMAAPEEIGLRALSRLLGFFGAGGYPPRLERLERLYRALGGNDFSGATLAGCRVFPGQAGQDEVCFCREAADVRETLTLKAGETALWDGRFEMHPKKDATSGQLKALGEDGWRALCTEHPELKESAIPYPAKLSLPALFRGGKVAEVPHLKHPQKGAGLAVRFDTSGIIA
ncbi:MAG: tRNA lysidine(34) synthetase TilS [Proteobacteria bacterium]|nr:tRNA lysidine(34) synthetase TilS [Pseudomonadota bacterium]